MGKRVVLVEHDEAMCDLLQTVLAGRGFQTECLLNVADESAEVKRRRPDLLVLDLGPDEQKSENKLLDDLRADPAHGAMPVVALTVFEPVAESLRANYNVKSALVKPFDLTDFDAAVDHALNQPPLPSQVAPEGKAGETETFRELAHRVLAVHSREAVFRWIQRLQNEEPWSGRRDLSLGKLMDTVPLLVEALAAVLLDSSPESFFDRHPEVFERARNHAHQRVSQGIPLGAVIREYTLLRSELWEVFRRYLPKDTRADDLLGLAKVVDLSLDRVVEVTIPSYLAEQQKQREAA